MYFNGYERPKTKKTTIDLNIDIYNAIEERRKGFPALTFGRYMNELLEKLLLAPGPVREAISRFCLDECKRLEDSMPEMGEFERRQASEYCRYYGTISMFLFSWNRHKEKTRDRNRIYLLDGYADVPKDWILLERTRPEIHRQLWVIETRHSEEYQLPHFVFGSDVGFGENLTYDEQAEIYDECIKAFPKFKEILNRQEPRPDLEYFADKESIKTAYDEHLSRPQIGFFRIESSDDPGFDPNQQPYGCVVYRNNSLTSKESAVDGIDPPIQEGVDA